MNPACGPRNREKEDKMKIAKGLAALLMACLLIGMLSCSKSSPTSPPSSGGGGGGGTGYGVETALWENTFWVSAGGHQWVKSYFSTGDSIKGTTYIVTGDTIDNFFAVTIADYYRWVAGNSVTPIYGWSRRTSDTFRFTIPSTDSIVFVWTNRGLIMSKQYYGRLSYRKKP
jgi:hypothetical protein